jgi:7-keto-8-aminopelargonate synthetase-like enzyme
VFVDAASHYSVNEAALLAHRDIVQFRHRDPDSLAHLLGERLPARGRPLVLTDGVFPATGALAPLPDYLKVLSPYDGASLIVDDAHGIAVLGDRGRGTLEWYGLWDNQVNQALPACGVGLYMGGTLSKAMGGYGGIIPASHDLLRALNKTAHYYDGASAPASPIAAATAKAIEIVMTEPELRDRLSDNIRKVRKRLRALGVEAGDEPSAIIGIQIGSAANMKRIHERLKEHAILVPYVSAYPGVNPEGLLRVAVCATHNSEMIDALLSALARIL